MKKFLSMLAFAALMTFFVACDDDGDDNDNGPKTNEILRGVIEENMTLTADRIWELDGRVIVASGFTLTIEPGTIIKGHEGVNTNISALMISRGAKIHAVGTAEKPIIMTSIFDNIAIGQTEGTNLDEADKGLWGGLVLLGKAPISVSGAEEAQIEGVPAAETRGLYGGNVANDDSGDLAYISIRHGGSAYAEGSEINGLTLGGVGNATSISNIEIFANSDDGVEFFGGTVNVSNILVTEQGDDAIDIDQAYSGTVDGFYVIHKGAETDEGLEIDGPEGAANADGKFTLKNGTLIGGGTVASLAEFKSRAQGTLQNVLWTGYDTDKKIKIVSSYNGECGVTSNAYKNLIDDNLVFTTVQFTGGVDVVNGTEGSACSTTTEDEIAAGLVTSTTATGGPSPSIWNWTLTSSKSLF